MEPPKNRRVSILSGTSSVSESPFKRRSILNLSTSMPPPDIPVQVNNDQAALNDDEAERRISRRFELNVSQQESTTNLAEHADSLNNCLKLFAENKINKDNAWNVNIIDHFAKLMAKHHHVLSNFQVAGTTLEASAKVYGLRVDSVYTDVCRMSADLARQSAKALTKRSNREPDDDDDRNEPDRDQSNANDENNPNASNQQNEQPKKRQKKKRLTSTITKNPDTLNGRLDTIPLTDPFFAKLNSVIGDTNSSKRLMQNIIPTEDSKLQLRQNTPIWNAKDRANLNLEEKINYQEQNDICKLKTTLKGFRNKKIQNLHVRLGLSNYRLSNEPIEREEENEPSFHFGDNFNNTVIQNTSNVGVQFDINAEVEPVPIDNFVMMDFGDMDQDDFEDLNDMDRVALDRCKGLKRQAIVIEDMQPETAASMDYSYRRLDMIDQFWAGPSHWKFRQSRRTAMSIGSRFSHATENLSSVDAVRRSKVSRKRKTIKKSSATFEDFRNVDDDLSVIFKISRGVKGTILSTQTILRKWDSKKHKLPEDFNIALDVFDKYLQASTIRINSNPDVTFTGNDDDAASYDYNNDTDRNYCVADNHSDTETETNTDIGQMDNNAEYDSADMPPPPAPVDEIPEFFDGAPERIEKIRIAFAKRAKVVDMKQLKSCSWELINRQHQVDPTHNPKFSSTLKDLPKVLNRTMAENMSMPLAFYAVLHLCNDKGLLLNNTDNDLKDFDIQFLNESSNVE